MYRRSSAYSSEYSYRVRAARERARRSRKVDTIFSLIAAILVLAILICSFLMFSITGRADETGSDTHPYKYYTSELITSDHTLTAIAREKADHVHYSDTDAYIREVCSINHLHADAKGNVYVAPGNYIVVPYYVSE